MDYDPFSLPAAWPLPFDAEAGARLVGQFAALGRAEARLAGRPDVAAMLRALGGNSPYLAELTLREPRALQDFVQRGPGPVVRQAIDAAVALPPSAPRPRLAAALRQAKRIVALATALADIGGVWTLDQVTEALSDLAETTLRAAVAQLL